jgi:hypothetical protein
VNTDLTLAAASAAYALLLEPFRPFYERYRLIWPTVAGGVALTGLALDRTLRHDLPPAQHRRVMRAFWRLFAISGLPMVAWQTVVARHEQHERRRLFL